jgi:hypothetical protein
MGTSLQTDKTLWMCVSLCRRGVSGRDSLTKCTFFLSITLYQYQHKYTNSLPGSGFQIWENLYTSLLCLLFYPLSQLGVYKTLLIISSSSKSSHKSLISNNKIYFGLLSENSPHSIHGERQGYPSLGLPFQPLLLISRYRLGEILEL